MNINVCVIIFTSGYESTLWVTYAQQINNCTGYTNIEQFSIYILFYTHTLECESASFNDLLHILMLATSNQFIWFYFLDYSFLTIEKVWPKQQPDLKLINYQ